MLGGYRTLTLLICFMLLAGCAETPRQRAKRIEPMLSAAGFRMHPADTPAREDNLKAVTPLKLRYDVRDGKLHYWFADPVVCNCLFTGSEKNYQRYEQLKLQSQMVQREQVAAELNEDAAQQEQFDWMMWPGPFY
jgi:hypothetical protein